MKGGDIGLFVTLVPKSFCNNVFLFVGLTTLGLMNLGDFTEFLLVDSLIEFSNIFIYLLTQQIWGLLLILIGRVIKLSVQAFQSLIVIYRRGNFVYHNLGCASILRLLSYPWCNYNDECRVEIFL